MARFRSLLTGAACVAVALVFAPLGVFPQAPPTPQFRDILYLNSYHPGYAWSDSIYDSVKREMDSSKWNTRLWVEYMDVKRFSGPKEDRRFRDYIASKYSGHKFDVVFTSDDDALKFMLGPGSELFGNVPVVFCGVNDQDLARGVPRDRMTGLMEVLGSSRILDIAMQWHPKAQHIWVVSDATALGDNQRQTFAGMAAARPDKTFTFLDGAKISLETILEQMRQVQREDIVILTGFARDNSGAYLDSKDAERRITAASAAPVYSPSISNVDQGIVAGGTQGGAVHGTEAAKLLLEVLGGKSPSQIPLAVDSGTTFVFDYGRLKALGIPEGWVPPGSTIANRPTTLFDRYRTEILGVLIFLLAQSAVIGLLVSNVYRRRVAQIKLAAGNEALKGLNKSLQEEIGLRQRTEETLRAVREQFWQSQKMEAVGRVAGGVAHDFNNLLTVINGFADLALRKAGESGPLRAHLEQVRAAGQQGARLTQQLLTLSRREVVQTRTINLRETVTNTLAMLRRVLPENIQMTTRLPDGQVLVEAGPGQIEQVLLNLAVNARDAMPHGGDLVLVLRTAEPTAEAIALNGAKPGSYAQLSVTDTGTGIDERTVPLIFEPFFTTKPEGMGTGLGLSTVYGIAKQNGGWVEVQSRLGEGSVFAVWLPLATSTGPDLVARPKESERPITAGSATILVVEDQKAVRELTVEILSDAGFGVLSSSSGLEGLEVIDKAETEVDLLLTDVVMPTMGGRELAERVLRIRPQMRILYMSGYPEDVVDSNGVTPGELYFIAKPFQPADLIGKVRQVLAEGASPNSRAINS